MSGLADPVTEESSDEEEGSDSEAEEEAASDKKEPKTGICVAAVLINWDCSELDRHVYMYLNRFFTIKSSQLTFTFFKGHICQLCE